jgi:hypothetical protein
MANWRTCSFLLLSAFVVSCDDDLPNDHGVTWVCEGQVFTDVSGFGKIPTASYSGGCDAMEPGFHVTEYANPEVPPNQVIGKCNDDCAGFYIGYDEDMGQVDLDGPISCITTTAHACDNFRANSSRLTLAEPVQAFNGGPASNESAVSGNVILHVDGSSASPTGAGFVSYTVGRCTGATCDFIIPRLAVRTTQPFDLKGRTVQTASLQNLGTIRGAVTGTQFTLPVHAIAGQFNFNVGGTPASQNLSNETEVLGTINPDASLSLDAVLGSGSRTVEIRLTNGMTVSGRPPQAAITPAAGTIECTSPQGAPVQFLSQATDPDNDLSSFLWKVDGAIVPASATSIQPQLGLGPHSVTLLVRDARQASSSAVTSILVADRTGPVFDHDPISPVTVGACGPVALEQLTATDACSSATVTNDAPAAFQTGDRTVTWTAKDTAGNPSTKTQVVTVHDTTPPTFTSVPADVVSTHCTAAGGLNIGTATATDSCGASVTSNAPAKFPLGRTVVTWTAKDPAGNVRTATQNVTVNLEDDATCCPAGTRVIVGTAGNDTLIGTASNECILGMGGNDTIQGGGGFDFIAGGPGDDSITGGSVRDYIWGGAGHDTIDAAGGDDFVNGGADSDNCSGGTGTNALMSCESASFCNAACCSTSSCIMPAVGPLGCQTAYAQSSCGSYVAGITVSRNGHNWECTNGNCSNCATFATCAPGATGCPWGTVWTDRGTCP